MGGPGTTVDDNQLQEVRQAIIQMQEDIAEMRDEIHMEHALLRMICFNGAPNDDARRSCLGS